LRVEGDESKEETHRLPNARRRFAMKSLFGNKLGSKLALAALAMCFFGVPGKAQDTPKARPAALACTSYPEWSREPQTVPSNEAALVTKAETDGPSCTSYPEWSSEPQTVPNQVRAKQLAGRIGRGNKSKQAVSDSTSSLEETFERRPY